jgi:iron complex outermembrane receptor protein
LRLSTLRNESARRHLIYVSARARDLTRIYGGSDIVDFGGAQIGVRGPIAEPAFQFGPQTRDRVRQLTLGLGYDLEWARVGTLSAGVQTSSYSKSVAAPGLAAVKSHDNPLLFNLGTTISITSGVSLYGSYTRGFEEGGVAPSIAVNRNEAAPALRTVQKDAGVRLKLGTSVRAVAGVFDIQKPYYGLDSDNVYRRLGALRNRGIEVSLAGEVAAGLNVVVGAVFKNPTLAVTDADLVGFGRQPLGTNRRAVLASLDYRLHSMPALSFDASLSNSGATVASIDNLLRTRPRTQLDVGARYRLHIGHSPATLRVGVGNLFNSFAWNVDNSGAMWASSQRSLRITLATDISPGREPG